MIFALSSVLCCISTSVAILVFETQPSVQRDPSMQLKMNELEFLFTIIFSAEFSLRFWTCNVYGGTRKQFSRTAMNILDFFAVMP